MEAPPLAYLPLDSSPGWDERISILLVCFAIACAGFATVLYGAGFLLKAMANA